MNFPTPLEALAANPHQFDDGDQVILPDGRAATLFKVGFTLTQARAKDGCLWVGKLIDLRPYATDQVGHPSQEQLNLW